MANSVSGHTAIEAPHLNPGLTPFVFKNNVTTGQLAAAETHVLSPKFGTGQFVYSPSLRLYAPTELDSDATPAMTYQLGVGDIDGAADDVLIADILFGNIDEDSIAPAAEGIPLLVDMSSKYLVGLVGTAPDVAVAGEMWVAGYIFYGWLDVTHDLS